MEGEVAEGRLAQRLLPCRAVPLPAGLRFGVQRERERERGRERDTHTHTHIHKYLHTHKHTHSHTHTHTHSSPAAPCRSLLSGLRFGIQGLGSHFRILVSGLVVLRRGRLAAREGEKARAKERERETAIERDREGLARPR